MNTFLLKIRVALLLSFLCLVASMPASAGGRYAAGVLDKKISLSMSNKATEECAGKNRTGRRSQIAYATQTIPLNNKVSIDVKDKRLGDVLEVLLSPYQVSYEAVGNQIIIQKDGMKMVISTRAIDQAFSKR